MKIYGIVYKATNTKITNLQYCPCYIGQTTGILENRKYHHKYNARKGKTYKFYDSIRHYGFDAFQWSIVCVCYNKKELDKAEEHYISLYESATLGYNMLIDAKTHPKGTFEGIKNPRYGDHRTWEELHGKDKSNQMKKHLSEYNTSVNTGQLLKKRREDKHGIGWNPMDDPELVKKSQAKISGENHYKAIYDYTITTNEGIVYTTGCINKFCDEHGFSKRVLLRLSQQEPGYISRKPSQHQGWTVTRELK